MCKNFEVSELLPEIPNMESALEALLRQVPAGNVTTYGDLAEALGDRIAARWVGHHMMHHNHGRDCGCHRVVRASGELGGYIEGGPAAKQRRIKAEGIEVERGAVDLDCHGVPAERLKCGRPLSMLNAAQEALTAKVSLRARRRIPEFVGGVDVSYPEPGQGVAGYALVELETGRLAWSTTVRRSVGFPYISSYLAFRELPILLDLLKEVKAAGRMADLLLVDGSGILHQRHAGVASHLGVAASVATIGVTKKLLCGVVDLKDMEPEESRPVVHEGRTIGMSIRPTAGSRRPIFVSPGHKVNVSFSELVVRRFLLGRRLPEPLYWADRLSRRAGRDTGHDEG